MKVFLLGLPFPFASEPATNPPLGLCYVASSLKKSHPHVEIEAKDLATYKDYDYYERGHWLKEIPDDADIYGLTAMSCQLKWLVRASRYILEVNPGATVVIGGPHASTETLQCMQDARPSLAVVGDGEHVLPALVDGVPPADIAGVAYWDGDSVVVPPARHSAPDLDAIPFPDRDIFDLNRYERRLEGEKAVHIVTLRGCPFNCFFCDRVSVGRNVRYRSVENVMAEIDEVIRKYGIYHLIIYDDIFTMQEDRVRDFCLEFRARGLKWRCWSRTDIVVHHNGEDLLREMRDAGMTQMTFGVESGDDRVLQKMGKGTTRKDNIEAMLMCKRLGIPVRCSLMYGNPGENLESLQNTIDMVKECQPDEWNLAILQPIPGTEFWDRPEAHGLHHDRERTRQEQFLHHNRFADSGIGAINISIDSMSDEEFRANLIWFVSELERVCPRKQIQDTIQDIKVESL